MGELAIGIGMLLAILGPLLFLPAIWLVYRFLALPLWRLATDPERSSGFGRLGALTASALLVLGSVGASYVWGKVNFDRLCALHGTPDIDRVVQVDGYFQTPLFPYQARQSLDDGTFRFIEGPSERGETFTRYTLDGQGGLDEVEIPEPSSEYGVRETFETARGGTTVMERVIYEIGSEVQLARAASLTYMGGPLSIFLGAYGMASCPDIRSPEGSEHFRQFYDLAAIVLGSG
jgi:hypothetical protein